MTPCGVDTWLPTVACSKCAVSTFGELEEGREWQGRRPKIDETRHTVRDKTLLLRN